MVIVIDCECECECERESLQVACDFPSFFLFVLGGKG